MNVHTYRVWRSCWARISIVLVCGDALCSSLPAHAVGPTSERVATDDLSVIDIAAHTVLNLSAGEVVTVQFSQTAGASIRAVVPVGEELRTL